jgi:CDP-6-deoxy-D-xylo-4-hexulose-3-dehydrase
MRPPLQYSAMTEESREAAVTVAEDLVALRTELLTAAGRYASEAWARPPFVRGETPVGVAGRVLGPDDLIALVDASADGWLTEGRFARDFATELAGAIGRSNVALTGSGSQANLLAVATACCPLLEGSLQPGDEVITPAVGFPTTVNPLYQNRLVPVYIDVEPDTLNPTVEAIADAISPRTRAVMLAHCLGNTTDLTALARVCEERGLVLIEDCCDALGSRYAGRPVGSFGRAATYSFYPAHQITAGEGGAVATDGLDWARTVSSLREWGRDCWCAPGANDACGHRFDGQFGTLPPGYDHKYVYTRLGFNFKITEMQAALGLSQVRRLASFVIARRTNFHRLYAALAAVPDRLVLPRTLPHSEPAWFGFPFGLRSGGARTRRRLQRFLLERRIDSRLVLAGNLTRQPAYAGLEHRLAGALAGADEVAESWLWVGVSPALNEAMVDWIAESVSDFVAAL